MKSVWKYELEVVGRQYVDMPEGSVILTVQDQYGKPCIWVEVDTKASLNKRVFETFGTGHPINEDLSIERKYIGTYQLEGGSFIGHVYEKVK